MAPKSAPLFSVSGSRFLSRTSPFSLSHHYQPNGGLGGKNLVGVQPKSINSNFTEGIKSEQRVPQKESGQYSAVDFSGTAVPDSMTPS